MSDLSAQACVPCSTGGQAMSEAEAKAQLQQLEGWELRDGATAIGRQFKFKNFKQALAFVNQLGELAEAEFHHPDIKLGWGYVDVLFQTHEIGGLHQNDFIMAARTNDLQASA